MITHFFDLEEIVCPDVFNKYGQTAWQFFDPRLFAVMEAIRVKLDKPIYVNDWGIGGASRESGLRCIQCNIVKKALKDKVLYMSAHMEGQALDFSVEGMTAVSVRAWIVKNIDILPYSIRLESDVNWVHLDVRKVDERKIVFFKG
jgi:uncharacterized protein YcbK (DUF882 family)